MSNYAPAPTVESIELLSIEKYEAAKEHIPPVDDCWWLRSPGCNGGNAAYVSPSGVVGALGCGVDDVHVGVRPALLVNPTSLNLYIGDKRKYGGRAFTYVAEGILLCDEIICRMPFREDRKTEDANDYEASDVKKYLDGMFMKHTLRAALGEMSYAFHTLHDHMKDHMPDYGCGNDEYALEVEESVANAYADFTRNEQKLKALIESL